MFATDDVIFELLNVVLIDWTLFFVEPCFGL